MDAPVTLGHVVWFVLAAFGVVGVGALALGILAIWASMFDTRGGR